jgi:hypothetical protein
LKTQKEGRRPSIFDTLWHFSLIDFYAKKYHDGSISLVLKSLAYFDDADEQEILFMFQNTSWGQLKIILKRIR